MASRDHRREGGRGERVVPGLWRLRMTLPWPGVPHCNAWAISAGEKIVLVDCGVYEPDAAGQPGSMTQLQTAMAQVGLRVQQVRDLVITHAHTDHWGQAAPVIERSGASLWMHPNHRHATEGDADVSTRLTHRLEIGRQSGVPERMLRQYAERLAAAPPLIAKVLEPDHQLVDGVQIDTDLGTWDVYETPGHAPSHICLYQPEHRILISGDHLLGRVSLYFDYGWTPDPVGELLASLDKVDRLDARLCLSGHGRPFTEVHAHVVATRAAADARLDAARARLAAGGDLQRGLTALEIAPALYDDPLTEQTVGWRLTETLCMLTHLEALGEARSEADGSAERWYAVT